MSYTRSRELFTLAVLAIALGLESAHVADARWVICAIPNVFEAGEAISRARSINSSIEVLGRAHSDAEKHLQRHGAQVVIVGEQKSHDG